MKKPCLSLSFGLLIPKSNQNRFFKTQFEVFLLSFILVMRWVYHDREQVQVAPDSCLRESILHNGSRAAEPAGRQFIRIEKSSFARSQDCRVPVIIVPAGTEVYIRFQRCGITSPCPGSKPPGLRL